MKMERINLQLATNLAPPKDPNDSGPSNPLPFGKAPSSREDLSYSVELWDANRNGVEQVLAVTASASIGYAAYYAAAREYPDRLIVFRHKSQILSRSNAPSN
jgi:hypothetical protein